MRTVDTQFNVPIQYLGNDKSHTVCRLCNADVWIFLGILNKDGQRKAIDRIQHGDNPEASILFLEPNLKDVKDFWDSFDNWIMEIHSRDILND